MTGSGRMSSAVAAIRKHCKGTLTTSGEELETFSRNFGGIFRRVPSAVFRPADTNDVVTALKIANEQEFPLTTRGSGHSQSGLGLGEGLVLDMRGLDKIIRVGDAGGLVEVEAGASWRAVVDATFPQGRLPVGLTQVLDPTVGGTLSVGGVGAESHLVGPQVDNVAFMDVATLDGAVIRCSLSEQRDLFDGVRAGLGQCGVILRVGYPLRPCQRYLRSRLFIYRTVENFMRDTENACARAEISFVSADFARDHRDASAWILVLTLGFEHEEGEKPPGQELIGELGFDEELPALESPLWCESGRPGHMFFWLHAFAPNAIDEDRATLHPWVDHIFRREAARQVLDEHLRGELNVLSVGTGGLTLIRRGADPAPLFVMPQTDDLAWGLGLFPSAHPFFQKHVLPRMSEYAEYGCAAGGKRYPAGFLELSNTDQWADHYGAIWPLFQQAKRRFDPKHLLNPGFMEWQ